MKVKIKDKELELVSPLLGRTHILYENVTGEPLDFSNINGLANISMLLYVNICATMQKNHMELDFTYDQFLDLLDEYENLEIISEYIKWLAELLGVQDMLAENIQKMEEAEQQVQNKKKLNIS